MLTTRIGYLANLDPNTETEVSVDCPADTYLVTGGVEGESVPVVVSSYPAKVGLGGTWAAKLGKGSGSVSVSALCATWN